MTMATAANRAKALIMVAEIILEAIQAAGSEGIPSGHLYAMVMGHINCETYQLIIRALASAGKITNNGHLLRPVVS